MYSILNESSYLLAVFFITLLFTYLLLSRKPGCVRRLPPALPSLPVLGSLPFLLGHRHVADYFLKTSKRLGDVFSLYAGSRYIVVLNGRSMIREALTTKGTDFASRPHMLKAFVHYNQPKGILFRPYDEPLKQSRKLTLSILKEFGFGKRLMETRIQEEVSILLEHIREMDGKPFYPHDAVMYSVGSLILSILYGRHFVRNDPKLKELMQSVDMVCKLSTPALDLFPLLKYLPYYRRATRLAQGYSRRNIEFADIQQAECVKNESKTESFSNNYLDNIQGLNFDRTELLFILRDLTSAGLDTSTNTILWSFILLANHRSVQDRLHAEIDAVIGRDRRPTLDDRKRLPYVEATTLETMRYRTLLPLSIPHLTLCDTGVNGYFVPAQTMVMVNLYSVHHDPDTWQDPDQFRPDRFMDDTGNLTSLRDFVIPFSIGKRSCLGEQLARQEIFLFIVGILQQFDIRPPEGQDRIDDGENFALIVQPTPFEVRLTPRSC